MKLQDPQAVGTMMRERRKKLGFTMQQMAEAVGVSPITIMRLELGRLGYIHERTAKALEVPKRITHRMVSVPVGVMGDGSTRSLDQMKAVPLPDSPLIMQSGDREALPPRKAPKREVRPLQRHDTTPRVSIRKKFFMWLAGE